MKSHTDFEIIPKEETAAVGYSSNIHAHSELKEKLHSLSDDEVNAIWQHVQEQGFHPDTEFARFGLEDKMTDDEFVSVLCEEVDERMRHKSLSDQ